MVNDILYTCKCGDIGLSMVSILFLLAIIDIAHKINLNLMIY